ncbi:MAG TPA: hypothetical protein VH277_13890 [Gemmatimonadaceae bacterium]|nr:hypothetical protein [Gemmatimonadaceae bacterium]
MYTTCLFCHTDLGANHFLSTFPVGRRLAFDPKKGRLWVICTRCGRWNLTPLEERWEAIDDGDRLFRGTRLRMSTDNVGLARFRGNFELVRIGPALLPEIASWRYGTRLARFEPETEHPRSLFVRGAHLIARATAGALVGYAHGIGFSDDAVLRMRTFRRKHGVMLRTNDEFGAPIVVRYAHLGEAQLVRPEKDAPWQLELTHDTGVATLAESPALRVAGKMLATLNVGVASQSEVHHAILKLDDAGDPEGYFARVASLAMRTSWGRFPDAPKEEPHPQRGSFSERLALQLANRSFWGRGGTNSDEATPLFRLPAVDRLALEMAANEDIERRALLGELDALHEAWKDAEEIAAIADELFADDVLTEFKRQYFARLAEADE